MFPISRSSSLLSFPIHLPNKDDSKDIEQDRSTKWNEPRPLNDCIEQSLLLISAVLSIIENQTIIESVVCYSS